MNFFNRLKRQSAEARLIEEKLYEMVGEEMKNGHRREGLWIKAIADSEGSEIKAKTLHISYRVQSIRDEFRIVASDLEAAAESSTKASSNENAGRQATEPQQSDRAPVKSGAVSSAADSAKAEESLSVLRQRGYKVLPTPYGWFVVEPAGGLVELGSVDELRTYAESTGDSTQT